MKPPQYASPRPSLIICSFSTGCATIVKGTTQEIPVSSDPTGARVNVDGSPSGTTPATLTLSRKTNHMVTFEKEGFSPESVAVTKSMGGAVAGNIIAGGLIGWGVDAMSGAQYNLSPKTISVRLQPTSATQPAAATAAIKTKEFVEELNKLDGLWEQKKITPEEYQKMRAALIEKYQK
ncbi:MAG: PEGA domain-containing protein [Opitutus sp.]|nr:PEGA domain-containing protein [Opitutus sp.]